jgi:ketosteroid isomerase-like protein
LLDWDFGDGQQHPFRWTAVMVERDGKLVMSASHVSIAVPDEAAFKLAHDGKEPALRDAPDRVDDSAKPVLAAFDRDIASPDTWTKDISDRPDVIALGSDPKEIWTGKATIMKEMLAQISQYHMAITRHAASAHVVAGGQLGWVMTNTDFVVEPEPGTKLTLPFRVLAVYLQEGGAWKMVQLHVSHAVPN